MTDREVRFTLLPDNQIHSHEMGGKAQIHRAHGLGLLSFESSGRELNNGMEIEGDFIPPQAAE